MVSIYWSNIYSLNRAMLNSLTGALSEADYGRYVNYVHEKDRLGFLAGRYLLHLFLQKFFKESSSLKDVVTDNNKRPFIAKECSFSISHSGDFVAVAFSALNNYRIGLDIEQPFSVDQGEYLMAFSEDEKVWLTKNKKKMPLSFFQLWTRKESLLKALGTGFLVDPADFSVLEDQVKLKEEIFCFKDLDVHADLIVSLCCNFNPEIKVEKIEIR